MREHHTADFPGLGSYSKFVEATNRYATELRGLLAFLLAQNRHARQPYPLVFQDSTALPVCKVARASQHRTFRAWERKSKTGSGWWYGFKLHIQCDEEGRLCAVDLTTAAVDERKLLTPLTHLKGANPPNSAERLRRCFSLSTRAAGPGVGGQPRIEG